MDRERWASVDRYLAGLLVDPDPVLDDALGAAAGAGLPPHEVSPLQGKLLDLLVRLQGASSILELGTLEADARYAEVARSNLERAGLMEIVDLRVGPALETLPELAAEGAGPFDLIFVDADKESNPEYLGWALRLSGAGTLIVADNVVREGVVETGGDPSARGVRRFIEQLAAEPRVSATAMQTVGAKGWDGFALALVSGD